ncbi:hypothetical protein L226DRAFT_334032 [Lentinus tigrinus ALCF2SS1-7]|uniref:uncharacterized protein n=1 Tax=Lentinus tigrinus ALCF2SS1-7 TaxID=1328758 RepID=UPI001165E511|nr:hypothetical protein L226DRAFT_334032 [Lentinus tigrinus ALCF2SS1-7]
MGPWDLREAQGTRDAARALPRRDGVLQARAGVGIGKRGTRVWWRGLDPQSLCRCLSTGRWCSWPQADHGWARQVLLGVMGGCGRYRRERRPVNSSKFLGGGMEMWLELPVVCRARRS